MWATSSTGLVSQRSSGSRSGRSWDRSSARRGVPEVAASPQASDAGPVWRVLVRAEVLAFFAACFLMAAAHGAYYTFYSIYLVDHGYSKADVGWLWALGVIFEIGVFLQLPRLMRRFTIRQHPGLQLRVRRRPLHRDRVGGGRSLAHSARAGTARRDLRFVSRGGGGGGASLLPRPPSGPGTGALHQSFVRRRWCVRGARERLHLGDARPGDDLHPRLGGGLGGVGPDPLARASRTADPARSTDPRVLRTSRLWDNPRHVSSGFRCIPEPSIRERANSLRQDLGEPCRARGCERRRAALHRSASGARGDEPAGVRRSAARASQAVAGRVDRRNGRSQHSDPRLGSGHPGSRVAAAGRNPRSQHPGVRRQGLLPVRRRPAGHRARDRSRVGRDAAGHDGRLRRFAHQHARRVRGARLRHRHVRGRARARDPVPRHEEDEVDADRSRRRARLRRDGEGHRPRHHRPHRDRGRQRLHARVRGQCDPRPVDGRADDHLQHVDRGRRAGGHGGGRRHDHRLPSRSALRAAG